MGAETKWAPAPWAWNPDGLYSIVDAEGERIAVMVVAYGRDDDRLRASGILLASAPALYAALSECLDGGVFKHPQIRERAAAVLARARGETP
jgi:hypothetical protein